MNESEGIRIGWAVADLTPAEPVHMAGWGFLRVSEGVMDPIVATVLALESIGHDTGDTLIMVGCDLARVEEALCGRVRERVAEREPGIDVEKIVLNATHNHGAPCVRTAPELAEHGLEVPAEWSYYGVAPDAISPVGYQEFAAPRIAEAIVEAWSTRQQGGLSFGLGHAVISHNRLVAYRDGHSEQYGELDRPDFSHIEGYEDHSVNLLYTWSGEGELTGVVVNVPCAAWGKGTKLTADFWHETREELRRRFGASFHVLQQVASSAELWPTVHVDSRAHERMLTMTGRSWREEIAVRLADAVEAILPYMRETIEWQPRFVHRVAKVKLSRLRVTEEVAEDRRRQFAQLLAEYRKLRDEIEANPGIREQPRWFEKISGVYWRMARAHRVVRIFERQQKEPTLPVRLHVVRVGDMAIAAHPVALYLDFGIQIRVRSKATQTFTVQTADGHYRYLPTERSLAGNTYGAVPESIEFGPQGGRELVDETVRLIESLWRDPELAEKSR